MKKLFIALTFGLVAALLPSISYARDTSQITDWYIKNFRSEITVNKDSSLSITETITADCGILSGKHGIFRILPTYYQKSSNEKIETPIKLLDISGPEGQHIPYSVTKDTGSITWKIGDANKAVTGENTYVLRYEVKNAIRFDGTNFDELYWNLNGNFWQIETDSFTAEIMFPAEISKNTVKEINLYSGDFGAKDANLTSSAWLNSNTLEVKSDKTLKTGEGITLSVTFPKSIIAPYTPTFMEKYGGLFAFLIPLFVLFFLIRMWSKSGKDPKGTGTIMAEYDIPDNLTPIELNILEKNGQMRNTAITAGIINLAVKGYLKIEEIEKQGLFGTKDFKLIKLEGKSSLSSSETNLLSSLFVSQTEIKTSDLKNKFFSNIPILKKTALDDLNAQGYFDPKGFRWQAGLLVGGFIFGTIGFWLVSVNFTLASSMILSGIIFLIFAFIMPRRTVKGAEAYNKILGFREFISKTEKYRANFNEKENIFEKLLPYAILFGLTGIWINNMKKIYGESYFATYHPIWFYGPMFTNFDANTFNSMVTNLSNNMNSAISSSPSSSGAGGGGFSGGGGGGGGGGGW